jgi:hypothetical protein
MQRATAERHGQRLGVAIRIPVYMAGVVLTAAALGGAVVVARGSSLSAASSVCGMLAVQFGP